MRGSERWSTNNGQDNETGRWFPRLREISIAYCGRLEEVSIGLIPSLRVLKIEECSEEVLRSMVSVSSSLVALSLSNVEGLTQLHREILMQLRSVENLNIEYCHGLRHLWPEQEWKTCKIFPSLQTLEVSHCTELVSLGDKEIINMGSMSIMESIKEVMIVPNFVMESYTCPRSVERLRLFQCSSMTSFTFSTWQEHPHPTPEKGFGFLQFFCLRYLQIGDCKNLKSFPHEHLQSLTSLEELFMRDCPSLDYSFPCGLWPPNLSILSIGRLNKPMSEWGHQNFPTSLVKLSLYGQNSGVVSLAVAKYMRNTTDSSSFLLPPSLVSLELEGFMDVESLSEVLQQLPCLKHLDISSCSKLKDLPETTSTL
ncbi:unnamed protein product [Lactuca virosa]|uniref:Uncharacterized protein n=1 Tax=Lactuca virosa TaxID=75947 RepID=A0AAU9NSF6_9ASTR|nr:unnamed protein product [Lactuca virosa]